jgi:hypothetical protein
MLAVILSTRVAVKINCVKRISLIICYVNHVIITS